MLRAARVPRCRRAARRRADLEAGGAEAGERVDAVLAHAAVRARVALALVHVDLPARGGSLASRASAHLSAASHAACRRGGATDLAGAAGEAVCAIAAARGGQVVITVIAP
jgi:hypothetical protein